MVAEMSHPGGNEFFSHGVAEQIAGNAIIAGADGIIAPATRPDRVRVLRGFVGDGKILSPGIGAQGGDADAIASLVDGIIVRPVHLQCTGSCCREPVLCPYPQESERVNNSYFIARSPGARQYRSPRMRYYPLEGIL